MGFNSGFKGLTCALDGSAWSDSLSSSWNSPPPPEKKSRVCLR